VRQDSLDGFMWMKFCRECPDLLDRKLTPTGEAVDRVEGGIATGTSTHAVCFHRPTAQRWTSSS